MKRMLIGFAMTLAFFSCVGLAIGSQVADVAKKEKERRGKISKTVKYFTNADIAEFKAKQGDTSTNSSDESRGEYVDPNAQYQDELNAATSKNAADEQAWRDRYKTAKDNVDNLQKQADEAQKTLNGMLLNVTNYDGVVAGPQMNAEIGNLKDKLVELKQQIADSQQAVEDLQEEARKAGVPPGWVRD